MVPAVTQACCASFVACVVAVSRGAAGSPDRLSDPPERPREPTVAFETPDSYEAARAVWTSPDGVSARIERDSYQKQRRARAAAISP